MPRNDCPFYSGTAVRFTAEWVSVFIGLCTYIGQVENGVPKPNNVMVNNTTAWMEGIEPKKEAIDFTYNIDGKGKPISYFIPNDSLAMGKEYFWLGDGFINQEKDNALYLFAYYVHKTGSNVFDFEQTNITLLKINDPTKSSITKYEQIPTDLGFVQSSGNRVYFGSGLFVNTEAASAPDPDGYVYIYGILEGDKSLIVARTLPEDFEKWEKWTFWDGKNWNSDKNKVASLADGVSNELSVTPTGDGRYLLTYTILGISDKIGIQVGNSPIGPFGEVHEVYTCPEYKEDNLLPYNAKAHYHLSKPGELLISYNTITANFWEDIQKDATIYHPRFINVKYQ